MKYTIYPAQEIIGEISVPGDKSISHRAVMMASLAEGISEIEGFLMGADCLSTISCFKKLGVWIDTSNPELIKVKGNGIHGLKPPLDILDAGNSGTTSRIILGILAGQSFDSCITGDASLRKRPMDRVIHPLQMMGAHINGQKHPTHLPLHVKGKPLHRICYTLPIPSAQLKSSLIMAGLFANGVTEIIEPVKSRNHTEIMLRSFGGKIENINNRILVEPVHELYGQNVKIPGDISSAAYFITAALILRNSQIMIRNVGINPTRTGILDVYNKMGAKIKVENVREINKEPVGDILVSSSSLNGITIEGSLIPRLIDEIPIIAVAAAYAKGTTTIRNAEELMVKESNRIENMVKELSKMGVDIEGTSDGMIIHGGRALKGTFVENYMDHRISMSLAIAALGATDATTIDGAEYINISFPSFPDLLQQISIH